MGGSGGGEYRQFDFTNADGDYRIIDSLFLGSGGQSAKAARCWLDAVAAVNAIVADVWLDAVATMDAAVVSVWLDVVASVPARIVLLGHERCPYLY